MKVHAVSTGVGHAQSDRQTDGQVNSNRRPAAATAAAAAARVWRSEGGYRVLWGEDAIDLVSRQPLRYVTL